MKKFWSAEESRHLEEIESKLLERGIPEHKARMAAEELLEASLEQEAVEQQEQEEEETTCVASGEDLGDKVSGLDFAILPENVVMDDNAVAALEEIPRLWAGFLRSGSFMDRYCGGEDRPRTEEARAAATRDLTIVRDFLAAFVKEWIAEVEHHPVVKDVQEFLIEELDTAIRLLPEMSSLPDWWCSPLDGDPIHQAAK